VHPVETARTVRVTNRADGRHRVREDRIAAEVPIALTYNRTAHVVMMATPADLQDFGLGFSLTEGIIDAPADLLAARVLTRDAGIELAMTIAAPCYDRLSGQRRNLTGRTGCGLCGAESLQQALRRPPSVGVSVAISDAALQRAIAAMPARQPLQGQTGAVHCAAWCDLDGGVVALREDVGRHNALDKLIGHLAGTGFDPGQGFGVVSSRASYEMVYKAAAVGVEVLAAVSAPTTLAVDFAGQAGLTLVGFARPGRHNIYTFSERIRQTNDFG
jgi:FdhD protein